MAFAGDGSAGGFEASLREESNPRCTKTRPLRVLLVEDSTPVRGRIRSLVEENGPVQIVGEANSVVDALAQFREQAPDAIILDLYLKDGNSFGVVTEVKRAKSQCAVIVLTSFATLETREHCLGLGADYFFEKNEEFERVPEVLGELHRLKNEAALQRDYPSV